MVITEEGGKDDLEGGSSRFAFPEKQVELGEVNALSMHMDLSIIVIAEYWPSWLMALQGRALDVKCFYSFGSLQPKAEFSAT